MSKYWTPVFVELSGTISGGGSALSADLLRGVQIWVPLWLCAQGGGSSSSADFYTGGYYYDIQSMALGHYIIFFVTSQKGTSYLCVCSCITLILLVPVRIWGLPRGSFTPGRRDGPIHGTWSSPNFYDYWKTPSLISKNLTSDLLGACMVNGRLYNSWAIV